MIKLATVVLISVLVLSLAAVAALRDDAVVASSLDEPNAAPAQAQPSIQIVPARAREQQHPQVVPGDEDEDESGAVYLGLVVHTLGDEAAQDMGIPGGVAISRVLDGGPADGVLHQGDVITAVDGSQIAGLEDLREWLRAAAAGQTVSVGIIRDGQAQDISVTLGARPKHPSTAIYALRSRIHKSLQFGPSGTRRAPDPMALTFGNLHASGNSFVRAEVVVETDDGFKKYTAVSGILSDIDAVSGTFTLTPRDGSDPISYEISDETVIVSRGDLAGLNTEDETLVVAVDGLVSYIHQGNPMNMKNLLQPLHAGLSFPLPRFDRGGLGIFREKIFTDSSFDGLKERLEQLERERQATQ